MRGSARYPRGSQTGELNRVTLTCAYSVPLQENMDCMVLLIALRCRVSRRRSAHIVSPRHRASSIELRVRPALPGCLCKRASPRCFSSHANFSCGWLRFAFRSFRYESAMKIVPLPPSPFPLHPHPAPPRSANVSFPSILPFCVFRPTRRDATEDLKRMRARNAARQL